jgi:hypothetical protein
MVKRTQTQKAGDNPVKKENVPSTQKSRVILPKSEKKSYWSTPEGKARAKQMSEDMQKHGKLVTRTKGK